MASRDALLAKFQKIYDAERAQECESLHNAIALVLTEQKASLQNTLFVLKLIEFELLRAKYEEIMGHVKLDPGKQPLPVIGEKKEKRDGSVA